MPSVSLKGCLVLCLVLAGPGALKAATLTVTSTGDSLQDPHTLRSAIAAAAPGDTIQFDFATVPATIFLASPLTVSQDLTIRGLGARDLTLDGGNVGSGTPSTGTRIFDIQGGTTVNIRGFSIVNSFVTGAGQAGGPAGDNGPGIRIAGNTNVTIDACTFQFNYADPTTGDALAGGAIYNNTGTLTVSNSSFHLNVAGVGAAIYNNAGTVSLSNCTLDSNRSAYGGPVFQAGLQTSLLNCTVTSNSSDDPGSSGGPSVLNGSMVLENSLLSLNLPDGTGANVDLDGSWLPPATTGFLSSGYNLISNLGTPPTPAYLPGPSDLTGLPALLAGYDSGFVYGGTTPTNPIQSGSPAIGAALFSAAPPMDQRRYSRNGSASIGAFEYNGTLVTFPVAGNAGTGSANLAYYDGAIESATAAGDGSFSFQVPYAWSGPVTPTRPGYTFSPDHLTLYEIEAPSSGTAFTATLVPPVIGPSTGIGTTSFVANWSPNPSATGYFLDVASDPGFTSLVPGYANLGVGNVSSLVIPGLSANTVYFFQVRATDGTLVSLSSGIGSAQTLPPGPSTTLLFTSLNPSSYGQSVFLTASVTIGATGSITFLDGATPLGTVPLQANHFANFTTTTLASGSHNLTAVYGGDANYQGSTSIPLNQVVNQAATSTAVISTPDPSNLGQNVVFTATVSNLATGTVANGANGNLTFMDGATTLGTVSLVNGIGTFFSNALATGSHNITAVYGGDGNDLGSSSTPRNQVVGQAVTATTVAGTPNPANFGQSVTFTATVTIGGNVATAITGPVTFKDGAATLGIVFLTNGVATFSTATLAPGSHSITAFYSGDGNDQGSTSSPYPQTVNLAVSTTTLTSSLNPASFGQSVTLTAFVPGGASGTVTFMDGASTLGSGTVATGQASFTTSSLAVGSHSLTAVYGGNSQYSGSTSAPLAETVGKGSASVSLGGLGASYDGTPKPATASTTPPGLAVTLTYNGLPAVPVLVGSYTVLATVASPSYTGSATGTLVISQGLPVITWANPADLTWGNALGGGQLDASTPVPGTFSYTPPAGTVLAVGAGQTLSVTFTPTDPINYASASKSVTINVVQAAQSISFPAFTAHALGDAPFPLGATASSGLAVTYSNSNSAVASISNGVVTILATGTTIITANQAGNADFSAAPGVPQTLSVAASAVPPQVTLYTLPDGAVTSDLVVNVSGLAQSANPLRQATVNGTAATLNADGSFSAAVQLRDASNPLTVVVTDSFGQATTLARTVTLDPTAPTLAVTAPADGSITETWPVTVTGTVAANQPPDDPADPVTSVMVALNGGAPQPATLSGTAFEAPVLLVAGWNELDLTATTAAGRKTQLKRTVFGSTSLDLAIISQPEDQVASLGPILIQGTVSGASTAVTVTLTAGGQTYTPTVVNGAFQQQVQLSAAGPWAVQAVVVDQLNNTTQVERNFIVDVPVSATGYSPADAILALRISLGLASPDASEQTRYDLAPLVDGITVGDGSIDLQDAMLVLRLALGQTL